MVKRICHAPDETFPASPSSNPDSPPDSPAAKRPRGSEQKITAAPPVAAKFNSDGSAAIEVETGEDELTLFHHDALGRTCFTREEADRAAWHVTHMRLDDRVKECLQRKKFVLPQQSRDMLDGFCNESVHGAQGPHTF